MGKAWNDAMALLGANFGLIATIVALFYFLPSLAIALLFPEIANPEQPEIPQGADPAVVYEVMMSSLQDQYAKGWPFMLFITLMQYAGTICVLALFPERGNPTVGEAIKNGLRGTPSYLATQIIFVLGLSIVLGTLVTLAFLIFPVLGVLVGLVMVVLAVYVTVKLILVPTIIGMEGELNPITALKRSWALTKGNSLMIFAFLLVLLLTVGLVALVVSLVLGTVFAIFGTTIANIGNGLVNALVSAVMGGLVLVVLASIHRQLTGTKDVEAFE